MNYNKQNYKLILQTAINQGFEFVDFNTVNLEENNGKQIILRHDVDYSLELAHEMAEIDAIYKIKSIFAVLISSPLYNPFTSNNIKIIDGIYSLGHNIVLHHQVALGQSVEQIQEDISKEIQIMKVYIPFVQNVFVWHNLPSDNLLSGLEVPDLVNAYSDRFVGKMPYISDSVLRNKPEDIIQALQNNRKLHLLLHPLIWMSEQNDMVSMMSYVLTEIIRNCDKEFLFNRAWKASFPNGIPQAVLDKLHQILNVKEIHAE